LESYLGIYTIRIEAHDNDDDRSLLVDMLSTVSTLQQEILDDDTTPPEITIDYSGSQTDGDPGYWNVSVCDPESGIEHIQVFIDGILNGTSEGVYNVPNSLGVHNIFVYAINADFDRGFIDQEFNTSLKQVSIIDDDITPPSFNDVSILKDPHHVNISLITFDDTGIDIVSVYVDDEPIHIYLPAPSETQFEFSFINEWIMELGTHEIIIVLTDADNDRVDDSLTEFWNGTFEITIEDVLQYVNWELDNLIQIIQNIPHDAWNNPVDSHTRSMDNKLNALNHMIDTLDFLDAYNKLLHDIKPKLTGLKEDEYGDSWGNGIFKKPWLKDLYWQEVMNSACNKILKDFQKLIAL
jgi:hypothetical protein